MGIDTKRWEKMGKDRKRYEKIAKDGGGVGERGFSCDVANARGLLNCRFPYLREVLSYGLRVVWLTVYI